MAVDGGGVEGRGAGGQHDLLGEVGGILIVDVLEGHDQVGLGQLLELQGVDVDELGDVADAQRDVQLLVVLVAALDDPVILDVHVQHVAVQVAPQVVGHGLVGMLGEVVGVQRVVGGTHEVHGDGLLILAEGIGLGQAAGRQHRDGQNQRQHCEQLLHGKSSLKCDVF